jgi:hypothetical protein
MGKGANPSHDRAMEMPVWLLLVVLVAIAAAAPRYGADSRLPPPGELPAPRRRPTVRGDAVAVLRAVRQVAQSHWPLAKTSSVWPPSSRRSAL